MSIKNAHHICYSSSNIRSYFKNIWLIRSFEVEERKGRIYFKVDNDEMILRHSRFTIIITSKDYKFFECTFVYYYSKD